MFTCEWCGKQFAAGRRDAVTCSQRCRQARWRFQEGVIETSEAKQPRRIAYADPPYPKLAHYYKNQPDYAGEVDHAELAETLQAFDGWALSTSSRALPEVLRLFPPTVRVGSWNRGMRPAKSRRALPAWEPVIYQPARPVLRCASKAVPDALVYQARPSLTRPNRVIGAKPAAFAWWLFQLLGAQPGDAFADLYPGTGAIGRAWLLYSSRSAERRL